MDRQDQTAETLFDKRQSEFIRLNQLLLEGMEGDTIEVTPEYIERKKAELILRVKQNQGR